MIRIKTMSVALGFFLAMANAFAIDTSEPFLCAAIDIHECVDGWECAEILPEEINAPTFFRVDLKKKRILITEERPPLEIEYQEEVAGRLVLQGIVQSAEDPRQGNGWTMSIETKSARFVATVAEAQTAFVIFGACTEL